MIISLSRTFFIVIIILGMFSSGYIKLNKTFFKRGLLISLGFIVLTSFLLNINNVDRKTFIGKVTTSVQEIQPQNYSSKSDINENWRGFEAFIGLLQYSKGSTQELILGQGFGKSAPLGFTMPLGGSSFAEIPKFHNGYVTIILKTGILGILLLLLFYLKLFRSSLNYQKSHFNESRIKGQFAIGILLALIVSTFVIGGWLNQGTFTYFIFSLGFMSYCKSSIIYDANK